LIRDAETIMEAKDFQGFIDQLSYLTETQRGVLRIALTAKGGDTKVLSLIETRFLADPACGHYGSEAFQSWGNANGLKRFRCADEDCGRTFNALTGTPLAMLRRRDAYRPRAVQRQVELLDELISRRRDRATLAEASSRIATFSSALQARAAVAPY
jgi:transposase-like protein